MEAPRSQAVRQQCSNMDSLGPSYLSRTRHGAACNRSRHNNVGLWEEDRRSGGPDLIWPPIACFSLPPSPPWWPPAVLTSDYCVATVKLFLNRPWEVLFMAVRQATASFHSDMNVTLTSVLSVFRADLSLFSSLSVSCTNLK